MKSLSAGMTALSILGATVASAQQGNEADTPNYLPRSGSELAQLIDGCVEKDCMSYVSGVINGIGSYAGIIGKPSPFCTGNEVRSNDIRDAIIGVIDETPQLGRAPAPAVILAAFSRNWPCASGADSVASEIDTLDGPEDLVTYADLNQVDMDLLLDFISKKTSALSVGDPEAPLDKTLHVFHDPNCEYCAVLIDELDALIALGWRAIIYPITGASEASRGYGAVQIAVRGSSTSAPEALFRHRSGGERDSTVAFSVAQEAGMDVTTILDQLAAANPYEVLETNDQALRDFGGSETPTWILGDRIASGITDADEIIRIQESMADPSQEAIEAPEDDSDLFTNTPTQETGEAAVRPGVSAKKE